MKYFYANTISKTIIEREISKSTDKFIFLKSGRRETKNNTWEIWAPSHSEARAGLLKKLTDEILIRQARLHDAEAALSLAIDKNP